jgi:hypothetical protein
VTGKHHDRLVTRWHRLETGPDECAMFALRWPHQRVVSLQVADGLRGDDSRGRGWTALRVARGIWLSDAVRRVGDAGDLACLPEAVRENRRRCAAEKGRRY